MACEEGWCDDDGRYFLSRGCQGSKDAREPISTCELEGVQNLHVPSDESAAKSAAESTGSQNSAGAVLQIRACEADSQEQRRHSSSGSDVDPMELLPVLLMPQIQPSHTSLERLSRSYWTRPQTSSFLCSNVRMIDNFFVLPTVPLVKSISGCCAHLSLVIFL